MKIRNDFVTNSSSSSFLISFENQPEERDNRIMNALIDALAGTQGYHSSCEKISTVEELNEYLFNIYGCDTLQELFEDFDQEAYSSYKGKIENGVIILDKTVDYSDEGMCEFIRALEKENIGIKILNEY